MLVLGVLACCCFMSVLIICCGLNMVVVVDGFEFGKEEDCSANILEHNCCCIGMCIALGLFL